MGTLFSRSSTSSSKKRSTPWYKNTQTRNRIFVVVGVIAFVAIFVASLELRMDAPILLMTAHNYPNIVAFNANTGAFITTTLLDLTYQKGMYFEKLIETNKLQFRSFITKDNQVTVVNGQHRYHFVATFNCDTNPGWKFDHSFGNDTEFLTHPYGLAFDRINRWWFITTQITNSLFIYNETGSPISLPGMKQHYPGAVFTILNISGGEYMDTFVDGSKSFQQLSDKQQKLELEERNLNVGLRGVALDLTYGLIFVSAEIYGNILVFDRNKNFTNTFNITLPDNAQPISVINGEPYFKQTLFISDRNHGNGIYAIRYSQSSYYIWWTAEQAPLLQHATGIAVSADSLFVLSQSQHAILRYNPHNGHYLSEVTHFMEDDPSEIITHGDVGKVSNPVATQRVLGEQLLYIPPGTRCTVK